MRFGVRDFRRLITAQRIVCGNAIQQLTGASIRAAGIVYRLAKTIDICSRDPHSIEPVLFKIVPYG